MNCSPRCRRSIRQFRLFFTLANADAEGRALNERIKAFVAGRPNAIAVASLGQLRYISLMNQVDVVVGNSSSGVYEAPSLNAPSVDIGDRQKGRERAASVFHAAPERHAITRRHRGGAAPRPAADRQPLWRWRGQPAHRRHHRQRSRIFARCCKKAFMTSAMAGAAG